jgi:replicative DNA helicase
VLDLEVIKMLSDRDNYNKYYKLLNKSALGEEANTILKALGMWHSSMSSFSWPKFAAWFGLVLHSKMEPAKMAVYKELFKTLDADPTFDPTTCPLVVASLIKRDFAAKAAELALKIADGGKEELTSLDDITAEYRRAAGKLDTIEKHIVSSDLVSVVSKLKEPGLNWRLNCLNESVGQLRKGDLVVVSTRPDTGKTTFCASEATYMATQIPADVQVLWVNNEEEGGKVFSRIAQAAMAIEREDLEADPIRYSAMYEKILGRMDKVLIFDKADASVRDVELLLERHKFGLVIFDQLWKLHGFQEEAGNEVTRQTMLFNWGREISKKVAPVIAVHQADGSAEGMRWIDMSRLYGSKTGIQGEADAIITIGRDPSTGDTRYLYVPKNKLGGTNKAMRNGKYEIQILPHIGRFKEF